MAPSSNDCRRPDVRADDPPGAAKGERTNRVKQLGPKTRRDGASSVKVRSGPVRGESAIDTPSQSLRPSFSAVGKAGQGARGAASDCEIDGPLRVLQFKRRQLRCRRNAPADPRKVALEWVKLAPRPQDLFEVVQHCALQPCTAPVFVASRYWPTGCQGDLVDLRAVAAEAALYLPVGCNSALPRNSKVGNAATMALCATSPLAEGLRAARPDLYWLVAHAIYRTVGEVNSVNLKEALQNSWHFQPGTISFKTFLTVARQVEASPATPGSDIVLGGYPAAALALRDKCVIFSTLFFGTPQWCKQIPSCAPAALRNLNFNA